jgi:hypothetical protein
MAHVAAYSDRAAERLGVVKNALAFGDELVSLGFPDFIVARLKLAYVSPCWTASEGAAAGA